MRCITGARFNMTAEVLRQTNASGAPVNQDGSWVTSQHPYSGEIIRTWQPASLDQGASTPGDPNDDLERFSCLARGIIEGGIRMTGTGESFKDIYEAVDYVRIWFPASVNLTRRDKVTNIRGADGKLIWVEEERTDGAPTVFTVTGVTPIISPLGVHTENMALLERSEVQ